MIHINIGYECGDRTNCDKRKMCKYGKSFYKLHNFSVELHRFFEYRFHIKLPYLIYVNKKWKRLSGTDKCPYNKSRNYTCWDCKYQAGIEECSIPYNDRNQNIPDDGWKKHLRCGSFEKCEWADDF